MLGGRLQEDSVAVVWFWCTSVCGTRGQTGSPGEKGRGVEWVSFNVKGLPFVHTHGFQTKATITY